MLEIVTTADLCEKADAILSMRFDGEYLYESEDGGNVYCQSAQWMFEDILRELEHDLENKGYTLHDGVWSPTSFYIGDPSLILSEEAYESFLDDVRSSRWGTRGDGVPVVWSRSRDGVFLVHNEKEHIGEITVISGFVAFIPESLADKDTVEKAIKEEHVLPPQAINMDRFVVEGNCVHLGNVRIDLN